MNVAFAAFCKRTEDLPAFERLVASAQRRIHAGFPPMEASSSARVSGRFALYNGNFDSPAWAVPTWLDADGVTLTVSGPPLSRTEDVPAPAYAAWLRRETATDAGLARLQPGHFGARLEGQRLRIWSDLIGFGRAYVVDTARFLTVSNHIGALTHFLDAPPELDETAWATFAGFGWFVGDRSPYRGITRLPPATVLTCEEGASRAGRYADPGALARGGDGAERKFAPAVDEMLVVARNSGHALADVPRVYLSGGRDSRLTAAAWIASGASASVRTIGTLSEEAVVAKRLMGLAAGARDLERQQVDHAVVMPTAASVSQPLQSRIEQAMLAWDGDYPPTRMMGRVLTVRGSTPAVGGGGGEIAHGNYYPTEQILARVEALERPMDRLVSYFTRIGAVLPEGQELIREHLLGVADEAAALGITGPTVLDYFYLRERFRRWVAAGHQTTATTLYASPAFIDLAFDVTPRQRHDRLVHRELTTRLMPEWAGVDYYKGSATAVDERQQQGLQLWQGESRDHLFETLLSGEAYRRFWSREALLDLSVRVLRGTPERRWQSVFQKVLWFEGFVEHARELAAEVRQAHAEARAPVAGRV